MIAIVDYNAGNLTSVQWAFRALGADAVITDVPETILAADRVVVPGVGAAGAAMRHLRALGLVDVLKAVIGRGSPFLGICLGAQILFDFSEEDGGVATLGFLPGRVTRFRPASRWDKVPHMGWNHLRIVRPHALLTGIDTASEFYFVHSYHLAPADPSLVIGETDYAGIPFASMIGRGHVAATQFHPEKSGRIGLALLKNFIGWHPAAALAVSASEAAAPC